MRSTTTTTDETQNSTLLNSLGGYALNETLRIAIEGGLSVALDR